MRTHNRQVLVLNLKHNLASLFSGRMSGRETRLLRDRHSDSLSSLPASFFYLTVDKIAYRRQRLSGKNLEADITNITE